MFADELDEDEATETEDLLIRHECRGCGGVIEEEVCPGCGYHEQEDE
jgi:rubrerythrin